MVGAVPLVDIRSAQPPIKEGAAIYDSPQWRRLVGELIAQRGRICEDANHNHNRTQRRKNALPSPRFLGRIYGDHIVEIADGGAPFAASNVLLRCAVCHGRKTAAVAMARHSTRYKQPSTTTPPPPTTNQCNDPSTTNRARG